MRKARTTRARQLVASNTLQPGDVLVVSSHSLVMKLITWWPWYRSKWNHVAVVHHTDDAGVLWCVEGRPGGVGWRNAAELGRVLHNADQPRDNTGRKTIADLMVALLKTPYDWDAIARDAFAKLDEHGVTWTMEWDGAVPPVHVMCSSLASYGYWSVHWTGPRSWLSEPRDWAWFIQHRGWEYGRPGTASRVRAAG